MINYQNNKPFVEGVAIEDIASSHATPMYVYSQKKIEEQYNKLKNALNAEIFYAVKANSNQAIIKLMSTLGAGADVVSVGELERAITAGINPKKIIFEGIGKSKEDTSLAINNNIRLINVESIDEIQRINNVAQEHNKCVDIGIRLNPNIDGQTIDKISTGKKTDKFGIDTDKLQDLFQSLENAKNIIEDKTKENVAKIVEPKKNLDKENLTSENIFYLIGDSYFIEGVKYTPKEDYSYSEVGLATFYDKELHNQKTLNNDLNKVTELLGRHKTLPLPSIVKITNLENGLSLTIKVIDRHDDNASVIQVSRKVAQLLRFYKNKIARVKVEILSDPSKQWKNVTMSINDEDFNSVNWL
mgnify:CR=1 FL=1